jgi:hypothetical protein
MLGDVIGGVAKVNDTDDRSDLTGAQGKLAVFLAGIPSTQAGSSGHRREWSGGSWANDA